MSKLALFTDIDDTLIARSKQTALLKAARDVHAHLTANDTALILVTGASFASVQARMHNGEIPQPTAIIAAVGTEIWLPGETSWRLDQDYTRLMTVSGYKKSEVTLLAGRFIREAPAGFRLMFQPQPANEPYKVSLHFMAADADAPMLAQQARGFFAPFKVIICQEIHYNAQLPEGTAIRKFCLDIVPATKADAVSYIVRTLGIGGGFKAGDSGNDIDMLLNPDPLVPILVGGCKPEAEAALRQELAGSNGSVGTLKDGRTIYLETGRREAAESLLHALRLLGGTVDGQVAAEGRE